MALLRRPLAKRQTARNVGRPGEFKHDRVLVISTVPNACALSCFHAIHLTGAVWSGISQMIPHRPLSGNPWHRFIGGPCENPAVRALCLPEFYLQLGDWMPPSSDIIREVEPGRHFPPLRLFLWKTLPSDHKAIPQPPDRLDILRFGRDLLDLLAQAVDIHHNGVFINNGFAP